MKKLFCLFTFFTCLLMEAQAIHPDRVVIFNNITFKNPPTAASAIEIVGYDSNDRFVVIPFPTFPAETDTGTVLRLDNISGVYYTGTPSSATTYTTTGDILGTKARVLINVGSQPSVTGATLIAGDTFVISTDMYMIVEVNRTGVVEYYFKAI